MVKIIKYQRKNVVSCLMVFQQRVKNVPLYDRQSGRFFSNRKYDSYKCWTCAELCEAVTFLVENIICAIWRHRLQINSEDSYGHTLLHDTSRYLNDIFTIDTPEFEKHIPDIYETELQLNKASTVKPLFLI